MSLSEVKGAATRGDQAEVVLRELEREAAANKALFESFLSRFKQTSEQEKINTNNSRVIERASPPTTPSAPNKKSIVILATLLGLGLGVGIAFLLEQLDAGYRTSAQIEKQLGTPLLASVPRSDAELPGSGIGRAVRKLNPLSWFAGLFDLPRLFGSDWFTRRTLRFAWHITSVAWLGFAALLVAGPGLILWLTSPAIAWWISLPLARREAPLSAEQTRFLRRIARKT